jgi:hypothetical protein
MFHCDRFSGWLGRSVSGILDRMKQYLVLLIGLVVCGCGSTNQEEQGRGGAYPGAEVSHVLAAPTRVEGWNFVRPDGTIMTDPPIRLLDLSVAKELGSIVLDSNTYRELSRGGGFVPSVGFRVWRDEQSVDVILSLGNDQMMMKYTTMTGQPTTSLASVTAAHDRLMRLARKAFPDYQK